MEVLRERHRSKEAAKRELCARQKERENTKRHAAATKLQARARSIPAKRLAEERRAVLTPETAWGWEIDEAEALEADAAQESSSERQEMGSRVLTDESWSKSSGTSLNGTSLNSDVIPDQVQSRNFAKSSAPEQDEAATKLQGVARQKEAKQRVDEMRAKNNADKQDKAATKLQGVARQKEAKQRVNEMRARKNADKQDKAATKLQGVARQKEAKQQVGEMRAKNNADKQDKAATKLQGVARQKEAKQRVNGMRAKNNADKQDKAATKLQGVARQKEAKQRVDEMRAKKNTDKQDKAATKLQGVARQKEAKQRVNGMRAKNNADKQGKAATKLQGVARQKEAKQRVDEMRAKNNADKQDKAATKLQGVARQKEAKQQVGEMRAKNNADKQDKAATKLQGVARQKEAKQRVYEMRSRKDAGEQDRAAIKLQSTSRKKEAARRVQELRETKRDNAAVALRVDSTDLAVENNEALFAEGHEEDDDTLMVPWLRDGPKEVRPSSRLIETQAMSTSDPERLAEVPNHFENVVAGSMEPADTIHSKDDDSKDDDSSEDLGPKEDWEDDEHGMGEAVSSWKQNKGAEAPGRGAEDELHATPDAQQAERRQAESSAEPDRVAPERDGMKRTSEEEDMQKLFAAKAAKYQSEELSKVAFKELVKEIMAADPPNKKDLDVAFDIADENKGGTVSEEEFVKLVALIKQGSVKGLGKRSFFFGGARRKKIAALRSIFKGAAAFSSRTSAK